MRRRLVAVAVPVPGLDLLTYEVPPSLPMPRPGARLVVPLGTRQVTGIAVRGLDEDEAVGALRPALPGRARAAASPGTAARAAVRGGGQRALPMPGEAVPISPSDSGSADSDEVRAIVQVVDEAPFLPPGVLELALWVAEYYACGPGEALAAALPPGARSGRATSHRTAARLTITAAGRDAVALAARGARLGPKQAAALERLSSADGGLAQSEWAASGITADVASRLVGRGLAASVRERIDRDPFEGQPAGPPPPPRALTGEQAVALGALLDLAAARRYAACVLHGVTGSGKTEVYLRLAEAVRDAGRTVLVLVPEIALTPALASIFRASFGARLAIQHSGLSEGERHDQWHRIRRGEVDVVVGTRSAVFAPLERLGLVVVDEEHDSSYKQEESPRYHGRDVAVMRARREEALVVLGSATPSLETSQNVRTGRYRLATLERRVLDRPLASVRLVNMRDEYAERGPDAVLSAPLVEGIGMRLARREQVLVLLNRRGFAAVVFCRQCTQPIECPNCSVSLTVHHGSRGRRGRCHYCDYSIAVPATCPTCASPYMEVAGFGTERIEAEVAAAFPGARVARLDRDVVRRKGAIAGLLARFGAGAIDILIGTQMIAKGHDFPKVTLVGVVSADIGLGLADFRAAERTFQLLTQVVGRAGRGEEPGQAIIQTLYPEHYSIRHACRQDYAGFLEQELRFRRAMRYPPVVAMINVIVRGRTLAEALDASGAITADLRREAARQAAFEVVGPAPAPMVKLRGEHRAQFFLKGTRRAAMREAVLTALAARPELRRRVVVDVDPLSVL